MKFVASFTASILFLSILPAIADDKEELAQLAKDLKHKDAKVRLKAVEAIEQRGEKAVPISRELCNAIISDKDARVAKAALLAVEKVSPKLYKPLSGLLLNREDDQFYAVRELGDLGKAAQPVIGVLAVKGRSAKLQFDVMKALEAIDPEDGETVKFFKEIAGQSPTANGSYHLSGVIFLVKWAGADADRRKTVYPYIKAGFTTKVTMNTPKYLEWLGDYGALSKDVLPAVKNLKLNEDPKVRSAASDAAEKIEAALKP